MIELTIDDERFTPLMQRVIAAAARPRPLMRQIAGILHDEVERNMEAQGRPRWLVLAPATIRRRAKSGHWPGKILQVSGRLASSILPSSDDTSARVGTNVVYAAIQHFGGEIKRAPYSSWVRLRTDRAGNLVRQGNGGNLARFAKAGHKRAKTVRYTRAGYSIRIQPRPYMVVTEPGRTRIVSAASDYLRRLAGP